MDQSQALHVSSLDPMQEPFEVAKEARPMIIAALVG